MFNQSRGEVLVCVESNDEDQMSDTGIKLNSLSSYLQRHT